MQKEGKFHATHGWEQGQVLRANEKMRLKQKVVISKSSSKSIELWGQSQRERRTRRKGAKIGVLVLLYGHGGDKIGMVGGGERMFFMGGASLRQTIRRINQVERGGTNLFIRPGEDMAGNEKGKKKELKEKKNLGVVGNQIRRKRSDIGETRNETKNERGIWAQSS